MKRNRFFSTVLMLSASIILINGCKNNSTNYNSIPTSGAKPGTNEVWMQNMAFAPTSLTITAGTTITWTNKDAIAHTVTSGTPANQTSLFDSGNLTQGQSFSYTFKTAGSFQYFCKIHPNTMQATITVK